MEARGTFSGPRDAPQYLIVVMAGLYIGSAVL